MLPERLVDELRAMQVLVTELAGEEVHLIRGAIYELFTPCRNKSAAQVLEVIL